LYQKRDKVTKKIEDPARGPSFSPKLLEKRAYKDKKTGQLHPAQIQTVFYHHEDVDSNGEPKELNPLDFLSTDEKKKYMKLSPCIIFDNIYIGGGKIAYIFYVTEGFVDPLDGGKVAKGLLKRNKQSSFAPIEDKVVVNRLVAPMSKVSVADDQAELGEDAEDGDDANADDAEKDAEGEEDPESEAEDPEPEPPKLPTPPPSPKKKKEKKDKEDGEKKKEKKDKKDKK